MITEMLLLRSVLRGDSDAASQMRKPVGRIVAGRRLDPGAALGVADALGSPSYDRLLK
jgi:hypothetical protein